MTRVLVAMSGGVDSSVAAALLREQGHDVVGVTMKLWGGESDSGCCSVSDVDDARRVAQQLGIDHHVFNFGDDFEQFVVEPYVADHVAGLTPNPCVECNRHLKFDKLLRRADALGFDLVATGHHARRVEVGGGFRIARGADAAKDQSYVLYPVVGDALARTLFPLGDMTKDRVRELAAELGLRTATKPDSQDVCFITRAQGGRSSFLGDRIPLRTGRVVDVAGEELGEIEGVELVTIGQRRGLDVGGPGGRRYVVDVDGASATVTVGSANDLLRDGLSVGDVVWAGPPAGGALAVQCSAHGRALPATVVVDSPDCVTVTWDEPQRRVAPGQSAVIYDGDVVVGGGIVTR
ncbi:MAG: tRNA 2-thiouridine(34) synthase MnmA [Acidimicrobiales bacterium]